MKRIVGALAVAALAVALFGAGALSPLQPAPSHSSPTLSRRTTGTLLAPSADAGRLDATIGALQQRLRTFGADATSFASLGLAYLQKARISADPLYYSKAEATLKKSLELDASENFQAWLGMGVLAAARHEFDDAFVWARRAQRANPHNADVRGVLGDALLELGRYRRAGRAFQAMIDLRPDLASYARASYFRELHGEVRGAIRSMRLAADAALGTPEDGAWVAYQLGELYFGTGRLNAARLEYRRGAWLAPRYAPARAGLAKVAAAHGNLKRATKILENVVDGHPSAEFMILLGDLYRLRGQHGRAETQYELVKAMEELYRANGVNTDLETALFSADHRIEHAATIALARAEYRRRHSVHAADALAWTLYARGSYRAAARYSAEALRLGTRNALFFFHRGMIDWKLGNLSDSRRYLRIAVDLNPHFSFFHRNVARRVLAQLDGARA